MTIELYDDQNHDGLFDILGKAFALLEGWQTAACTTIPGLTTALLAAMELPAFPLDAPAALVTPAQGNLQAAGASLASVVANVCNQLVVEFVKQNSAAAALNLPSALQYVIDAMLTGAYYVDANAVTCPGNVAADGTQSPPTVVVMAAAVNGLQLAEENVLAEDIAVSVTGLSVNGPTLLFSGERAGKGNLYEDFPAGSGCNVRLTATDPANSLLSNGDCEAATYPNVPDDWTVHVGTVGTTVHVTAPEEQSVAISGVPTGGFYVLLWNDGSHTYATEQIAYNAGATAVRNALRAIPGLEEVTVTTLTAGTPAVTTHTVVFEGTPGNVAQLTSLNQLTGGTTPAIAHATTVAGDAGTYRGRALKLTGKAAPEETALYHVLDLEADTLYFVHAVVYREASATGVVKIEVVDGLNGSVIDSQALTLTVENITAATFRSAWMTVRRPAANPAAWLRVRASTALNDGKSVWIDEMSLVKGTQLYAGGPWVAAVATRTDPALDATWTLTATNDRAGQLQTWFDRAFDMAGLGLLLPSAVATNLIPDSVIS